VAAAGSVVSASVFAQVCGVRGVLPPFGAVHTIEALRHAP
jgi:hypothetical protein